MTETILTIAIGLVVGLLFAELFSLVAGGMIVPGYLALQVKQPGAVLLTLALAFLAWFFLFLLDKVTVLYGRRRIAVLLLIGFTMNVYIRVFAPAGLLVHVDGGAPLELNLTAFGFIIPGLIALCFDRQGVVRTVSVLSIVVVCIHLIVNALGGAGLV